MEAAPSPFHDLPSGLCEDSGREAAALIQRMARGDDGALNDLHALWAPVLLGIGSRMLGAPRQADKLLQQVFVRMWKSASSYDPHKLPPFVWAYAMLRDTAAEWIRRGRVSGRNPAGHAGVRNEHPNVLSADDCRRLKSALELLDPEERLCLEQAALLDFARRPAADPPSTAGGPLKTRLRQALETVRTHLSRHEL